MNKVDTNQSATPTEQISDKLWHEIEQIIEHSRHKAFAVINTAIVLEHWLIGRCIVEEEQQGKDRADYGKQLIRELSKRLTSKYSKGFSESSLYAYRRFYNTFPEIFSAQHRIFDKNTDQIFSAPHKILTWNHYKALLGVINKDARNWYLNEAYEQTWSYRTLDRNISSQYYERLLMAQNKQPVLKEMEEKTAEFQHDKLEFIKNPTVAEFLGLSPNQEFTESDLESAIISNLQKFLMELGKGFAFVARQQHIKTEKTDYFIDLVFYNYILKCFVLIDLKTSRITHQDVGQMDMYIRMFDELKRANDDNPTLGIVLCADTDEDIARYSILNGNDKLFASKYKLYMPTEEELRVEIERQKEVFLMQHKDII